MILATEKQGDDSLANGSNPVNTHKKLAEGVGFEPTVAVALRLISSQVPLTTQPPFRYVDLID